MDHPADELFRPSPGNLARTLVRNLPATRARFQQHEQARQELAERFDGKPATLEYPMAVARVNQLGRRLQEAVDKMNQMLPAVAAAANRLGYDTRPLGWPFMQVMREDDRYERLVELCETVAGRLTAEEAAAVDAGGEALHAEAVLPMAATLPEAGAERMSGGEHKSGDESPVGEVPGNVNLSPRVASARDQYLQACEALGKDNPTDREAYELIEGAAERAGQVNPLPAFSTWTSYLRQWRRAVGQQKHAPRGGRALGGASVVRADQLDGPDRPGG